MAKTEAYWNGQMIAASDHCILVEGNAYFPLQDLRVGFFQPSQRTSVCHWKGNANYFDVVVDGKTNPNAAWTYHAPKDKAVAIKDYVAFWNSVEVTGADAAKPL
ncbi:DUF427 domain-containing protein [Aestuariivirga litoralis]|uniref:DUF427 domain-containing protein n=1 Tax=Aestuariivirga litoralis TaxID=2650924 RepID=UPI0018C4678D|nr:DUF427 domain-containing protein [Aestuariivirga litoralis]MBG1232052.1 DUF427 domain-containing protein [Aestuariivirga litoralis]